MRIQLKLNVALSLALATSWSLLGCFELVSSQSLAFLGPSLFTQGLSWVVLGLVLNVLGGLGYLGTV